MPGRTCAVAGCRNNQLILKRNGARKVIFHNFPAARDVPSHAAQKEWIFRCNRADKFNVKNSWVCSDHFNEEDYERDLKNELLGLPLRRKLKKNAYPTLKLQLGSKNTVDKIKDQIDKSNSDRDSAHEDDTNMTQEIELGLVDSMREEFSGSDF